MMKRLSVMAQNMFRQKSFTKGNANSDGWSEKQTLDGVPYYVNANTQEVTWDRPAALRTNVNMEKEAGEWTWVPHPDDIWQPARKVETLADGSFKYETQDDEILIISADGKYVDKEGVSHKVEFFPLKLSWLRMNEDDLIMLDDINKAMIMYSLRIRYLNDELYTWVGASHSVLVSVNPYKNISKLYNNEEIQRHRNRSPNREVAPHVFDIANDSYDSMLFDSQNQSILISGESGAGKTEATKQCLKFIATIAGSENHIETRILQANPVLEAFGNAKTIRNNNSSRFGKWIEVYFAPGKRNITSGKIINYLLEKSRLVHQQGGERNFHIFYQMAADSETNSIYSIGSITSHRYLSSGITSPVKGINDKDDFAETKKAMIDLGFTPEEMTEAFKLTAFVLHLGNCTFKDKAMANHVRGSELESDEPLNMAKNLLGVDAEALRKVLLNRSITVRGETSVIPLDPAAARAGCDSLAKGVYGRLFDWLVTRINDALAGKEGAYVGILDIFGFEIFENNSFEQLCINFTNEKLQQLFNKTTFKEEEALYENQKIKFTHVEFIDNQIVLDLIEQRPNGILPLLDDECLVPEGSDAKFMLKLEQNYASHPKFQTDKKRKLTNTLAFEIKHYAGVVCYDASAFFDKNKDTFFADCYELCGKSSDKLTKLLFPELDSRLQTKSLSTIFRGQLNTLMEKLNSTRTRYIRCVKPNDKMQPDNFNTKMALEQLTYSGVFEAVQIRKQGYPFRWSYPAFANRYRCINPNHKYKNKMKGPGDLEGAKALCREILDASKQNFKEVQFGTTMVLYHANEHRVLKLLRNLALETIIPRLQKYMRGFLPREMKRRLLKGEKAIRDAMDKKNDYYGLKTALEQAEPTIGNLRRLFKGYKARNIPAGEAYLAELKKWVIMEQELKLMFDKDPNKVYKDFRALLVRADAIKHIPQTPAQIELVEKSIYKLDNCAVGLIDSESQKVMALPKPEHKREIMQRLVDGANKHGYTSPAMELVTQTLKEYERIDQEVKDAMSAYSRERMIKVVSDAKVYEYRTGPLDEMKTLIDKFDQIDQDCEAVLKNLNREKVLSILEEAKKYRHKSDWVSKVEDAEKEYERIDAEAVDSHADVSRERMIKVLEDARACNYNTPDLDKIKALLETIDRIDQECEAVLKNLNREKVSELVSNAKKIRHKSDWVSKVEDAEKEYNRLEQEAKDALKSLSRERLLKFVADANACNYVAPELGDIKSVLDKYDQMDNICKAALDELNREKLEKALADAKEINHTSELVDKVAATIKEFERVIAESQSALDAKNPPRIIKVLAAARAIKYTSPVIDAIIEMVADYDKIDKAAQIGIDNMDRSAMQDAIKKAQAINHVSDTIKKAADTLQIPEKEFVTRELQVAEAQNDKARAIHRKIRLAYMELDEVGSNFSNYQAFPELRTPDEFAAAKMLGKAKLKETFYIYNNFVIPTSLTKSNDAPFKKQAIAMNKMLLTFTGEVKGNADEAASGFLSTGNSSPQLKNEMYCQLFKHITDNPDAQSQEKAWTLLGLACRYVLPTPQMEKYVLMFAKKKGSKQGAKWFSAMNECRYGGERIPSAGGIPDAINQFNKLEEAGSRFSIHGDGFTGPTNL